MASMTSTSDPSAVLERACEVAAAQPGGTLATMHAEDGTPYVTYVLFHLRENGQVLFGSLDKPQHARNLDATPECSFLIDNRDVIPTDANLFARIVIEGRAEHVAQDDADYSPLLEELRAKSGMAAEYTAMGRLYRVVPRRIVAMEGFSPDKHIIDYREE